jgi:dTDP-glucose 4,6-dehydratase
MKTIFVTGGAGFIGSEFVRLILNETSDVQIINFDALTYAGNPENLKGIDQSRHQFIKGDISKKDDVFAALPEETDAIFNFAAESHVDRSITSASEFVITNVLGTQVLLDAARAKDVRRFVQISTDEVMGTLPESDEAFFAENSPLEPNSPYAASKAAAEHFVRATVETFGIDAVVTRCGNNYGQRQFPEKLIPLMISNAMNNEPLPVYGDGKNVRDWIFVEDHCRAIWEVYDKGKSGESYNIGARNERQNLEVVQSILDALGKPHSLIKYVSDRLGHDRRYAIDATKVENELGWKPLTSWEEGLQKTIRWYQENKDWVNHIRNGEYRNYYKEMYGGRLNS